MNILISGGTGFIGSALTHSLVADGHKVWILTRDPARFAPSEGVYPLIWDGRSSQGWLDVFARMDAVVNLAGETIGRWPWTAERKKRIQDSRVAAGLAMAEAFDNAFTKPPVLIQASGIGYYGPLGPQSVTEADRPGQDFIAQVAVAWEDSTSRVDALPGVRRAIIRTSLVLDKQQGILPLMALPARFFIAGPLGNGQQGVSWIHINDEIRAIRFLIENQSARGAFNLCAPQPVSNVEFVQKLAKEMGRPYWLPAPGFAIKFALGEMSTLLLDGQYAFPKHLVDLGFQFNFARIETAFQSLYSFQKPE